MACKGGLSVLQGTGTSSVVDGTERKPIGDAVGNKPHGTGDDLIEGRMWIILGDGGNCPSHAS